MLKKIISIKNVGKFTDCNPAGDVEFRRLTLFYAENGRGKTTLCDIFRSLRTGDAGYITGRKTLGSRESQAVALRIDGATADFKHGKWSNRFQDIALFDLTYIHENVHAGDYVDHEHKKNLYRIIVGERGVALARKVTNLGEQIKAANADVREKRATLSPFIPTGTPFDAFLAIEKRDEVDEKIKQQESRVDALKQAGDIEKKPALALLDLPTLPANYVRLLGEELEDVSKEAERLLSEHIENHTTKARETWLSDGLEFVKDDACPFCGNAVQGNALLAAYRTRFGESYAGLKDRIVELKRSVTEALGQQALLSLQKTLTGNCSLAEFWKKFATIEESGLSFDDDVAPVLQQLRETAHADVDKKLAAPLEPVLPGPHFTAASADYDRLKNTVTDYNAAVTTANTLIAEKKTATEGGDLSTAVQQLALLKAAKRRHEPDTDEACSKYELAVKTKELLEAGKEIAKVELDQYSTKIFGQYETRINRYLEMFNAGFRIVDTSRSYAGGEPSSSYQVLINDVAVSLGDATTPIEQACFKNTLSAGDRSTLALAFFLAQQDQDPTLAEKVIVLDDPFNSQDGSRRTCTQQLICKLATRAKQVIVLSHSPQFLKLIWDNVKRANVKTLQLFRLGKQSTTISEWDIEDETRGDYFQNHWGLTCYLNDGTGDRRRVAQAIRPVLEKYLRFKLPRQFGDNEWLGDMIRKIRLAEQGTPLFSARAVLDEVEPINGFSKKYHHDQNPGGSDTEPIDDGELQAYVKRTLDVVGGF